MLLQDHLLVGPSRVGRIHTGRIPQQSSQGARRGNLGQSGNLLLEMVLEVQVLAQVQVQVQVQVPVQVQVQV